MTRIIMILFIGCFIISCGIKESSNSQSLEGKKFQYNYEESTYIITFNSDEMLNWECVKGNEKGKSADENYLYQKLNINSYFYFMD